MLRNKRIYAAYFLSSSFSVLIFFVCALFLFHPDLAKQPLYTPAKVVLAEAVSIMYVFCFLFVLYSVGSFLRSRRHQFGTLLLLGMTDKQLRKMLFYENMLIGAGAIVVGMIGGLLTAKLFLMAGSNLLGIVSLPFHVSLYSLLLTIGAFALLFLVISLCTMMLLGSTRLIDLFQSDRHRGAPPQASKLLSLFAALLLMASYYLAASATASTVLIRMVPVTCMTIVGTYFLYTQLSLSLLEWAKRTIEFYWKKTNLVTISNLSYRLKDNSRMFFLVTIVSTVTFCAIGVFASINRLSDEFEADYPADIAYVAKPGSRLASEHLEQIRSELQARQVPYQMGGMDLIYVKVKKSTLDSGPRTMALVGFADYEAAVKAAGLKVNEHPPGAQEALILLSSQRERLLLEERKPAEYTLEERGIRLRETGITEHVAVPEYLTPELGNSREGTFSGLVVNDSLLQNLKQRERTERFTGFYADQQEQTVGMAMELTKHGKMDYEAGKPYALTVSGTLFEVQRSSYGALLFFALLVGTVFYIAAGSVLYFRLYSDLDYDRRQYAALTKLGLTHQEMEKVVSQQLALLFFVPIGVAMIHSLFAFIALQSYLYMSIAWEAGLILSSFCLVQVVYFLFIRARYLRNLQKAIRIY
ncbi:MULTISPECIES: ABC transporter permease [unclassified Paenibacillus]|uniref:ABC transporter permease n=1 Tax=unclassified Paenibacillus TaxID=185978 RepID=UPI000A717502|nr:ABC transporter permease [Paenibacillus sp. GM2]